MFTATSAATEPRPPDEIATAAGIMLIYSELSAPIPILPDFNIFESFDNSEVISLP